ncbi:ankyrin repeat-containing domain protein, partial [Trichophaea hybrida]
IYIAALNGHEGVVRLLLERNEIDVNPKCHSGNTPLWIAACNAHTGVVRLLLGRCDINDNLYCYSGLNPLRVLAGNGLINGMGMRMDQVDRTNIDINVNSKDNSEETISSSTALKGHKNIDQFLLEYNVNEDKKDPEKRRGYPLLLTEQ